MVSTKRILYVEDDQDTCLLMQISLTEAGHQVVLAGTVAQGLAIATATEFDLFLIDACLPDGSGFDLCRKIRDFNRSTPILFFSALAFEADRRRAFEAGAAAYIVKPALPDQVLETIEGLTRQQPAWLEAGRLPGRADFVKATGRGITPSTFTQEKRK